MNWIKLGNVFCANGQNELMHTGGRAPVARWLEDDFFEIYFASYDQNMRGRIFKLVIDIKQPTELIKLVDQPLVDIGNIGFFDDNGVIPSTIVDVNQKLFLYTIGFSMKNKIIFDAATGLAISKDGGNTFEKLNGPVLDRGVDDPCFAASPYVMIDDDKFKMWYVSCDYWTEEPEGKYKHFYNIKYKESEDGIYWDLKSKVCIDYQNEFEYAISRPTVIKETDGTYKMWYSFRGQKSVETYRIGYAESNNGIDWVRKDELMKSFDVSESGWDSEMMCYPYVFDHKGDRYMLYNGNGYGRSGFGLAKLEK